MRGTGSVLKHAPMGGVVGFDVPALLAATAALGLAGEDVLFLLPDLESGLLEGLRVARERAEAEVGRRDEV